jgi:hypothetical protein
VEGLLIAAVSEHLVDPAPGPPGGNGFKVNPAGAAFVSEVELPREKFVRRAELDEERNAEAKANPGPVFVNLLQAIPKDKYQFLRDRGFIELLVEHWLNHGWLSSIQVEKMSDIAAKHAVFVEVRHYIGSSLDEWRQPFLANRAIFWIWDRTGAVQGAAAAASGAAST